MNTKLLMTGSSVALGSAGIALTFLPEEILAQINSQPTAELMLIMQMLGALYFGFGMVNWLAKENLLGGIYGRPVVVGNVAHFVVGALALIKGASLHSSPLLWAAAVLYTLFAFTFGLTMVTQPKTGQ